MLSVSSFHTFSIVTAMSAFDEVDWQHTLMDDSDIHADGPSLFDADNFGDLPLLRGDEGLAAIQDLDAPLTEFNMDWGFELDLLDLSRAAGANMAHIGELAIQEAAPAPLPAAPGGRVAAAARPNNRRGEDAPFEAFIEHSKAQLAAAVKAGELRAEDMPRVMKARRRKQNRDASKAHRERVLQGAAQRNPLLSELKSLQQDKARLEHELHSLQAQLTDL